MFLRFSKNHVFQFPIQFLMPSTMFFRSFFLPFDRACKDAGHAGHDVVQFLKKVFFCALKKSPIKFACSFLTFFEGFFLVRNFSAHRLALKQIEDPNALHLCMFYRMVKKNFEKIKLKAKSRGCQLGHF